MGTPRSAPCGRPEACSRAAPPVSGGSGLAGQSGVGKSSLLNALDPGLSLRIGEISAKWGTGKHTTRAALVVPVATGGYVVDTPGLREVGTWGIDPELLGAYFAEFQPFLDQCRDRKSTRLNSSHGYISYAVFCLKKKKKNTL